MCDRDRQPCFLPTHWFCLASRPTLPAASPLLQASRPLSLGSSDVSSWCHLVAVPKVWPWCKSAHPAFLPGACALLPSLRASSCPGRFPESPLVLPWPSQGTFTCLSHPLSSVNATPRRRLPEARVAPPSYPQCAPRPGTGCGKPQEGLQESLNCFPGKSFYRKSPRLINSPKYQVRHLGASPPGKRDFGSL